MGNIYDSLNPMQREAVLHKDGPLLILAGAGSGKTRVLTHRIAYLIGECDVNPFHILAITFTNKAAKEMRDRVDALIDFGADSVWVSTFHSLCVRILRKNIDLLGYDNNFTIYDSDDQKSVVKDVMKRLQIDTKTIKEKTVMSLISKAKDECMDPGEMLAGAGNDFNRKKAAQVYVEYQKVLKNANALDFDDLIMKTVELFKKNPDVLERYQERFKYIMVDEYQDTNTAQFKLISLLAAKYQNLCVVGDDDQSIYKFRGANISNILNFEATFTGTKVIKLEQNYRSTQNILDVANSVIKNNAYRKSKALWSDNGKGDLVKLAVYDNGFEEADGVVSDIVKRIKDDNCNYNDFAILYRTNAQSRAFEERLVRASVPYKLYGGINFYGRREIKDILAYLKTIDNGKDDLAVKRIINVPKRGLGATSLNRVQDYALDYDISFWDALCEVHNITSLGKSADKFVPFVNMINVFKSKAEHMMLKDLVKDLIKETGYIDYLREDSTEEELEERMANIDEFISKAADYEEENIDATLSDFLSEIALVAEIDSMDNSDQVTLMTIHSAKGLEFPIVYMVGMDDGVFPSFMNITSEDPSDIEEERRLCYVGITRAMKNLTLTTAKMRTLRGETLYYKVSRFVKEIPDELLAGSGAIKKSDRQLLDIKPSKTKYYNSNIVKARTNYSMNNTIFDKPSVEAEGLDYAVGDRVKHMKFGPGTVTAIVKGGKDYEVTVNFDVAGVKKMLSTFAKLVKL